MTEAPGREKDAASGDAARSGCDHVGPVDLMAMAENHLRERGLGESAWEGTRFAFGENVDSPKHKSVYTEVERRDGSWLVTRLERRPDPVAESESGFTVLTPAGGTPAS